MLPSYVGIQLKKVSIRDLTAHGVVSNEKKTKVTQKFEPTVPLITPCWFLWWWSLREEVIKILKITILSSYSTIK